MQINLDNQGPIQVVALDGRLDANTSKELEERLLPLVNDPGAKVLVDCSSMAYISSAGLRVFLMAVKKARKAGSNIVLSGLSESVTEVFDISGFSALFTISPDRQQGIQALA